MRCVLLTMLVCGSLAQAETVHVSTDAQLRDAIANAHPGDTIRIAPGNYRGGMHVANVRGTAERPVTIQGDDPDDPPIIRGGNTGLHLVDPAYLMLRFLVVEDAQDNGINIDDGGDMDQSAHHVILEHLTVRNIGPRGNHDGIKLSGVKDFIVRHSRIETWGSGGSGIDMVGCRDGVIERCTLVHLSDTAASSGVQAKGGTHNVIIRECHFNRAGRRAINLGGSTGDAYFRPPLKAADNFEARQVMVHDCTFVGSNAPIAFTTSIDCRVERCTFYRPGRWVFRILQEKSLDRFMACGRGQFIDNVVVWRQGDLHRFVNVGPNTKPDTFTFRGNWWYCEDAPDRSKPDLPTPEAGGVYGRAPGLKMVDGVPTLPVGRPANQADVGAGMPPSTR